MNGHGLSDEAQKDLDAYLLNHESDIANDINDFGDLKRVFIDSFWREPKKETEKRKEKP
jgi:hypothetical protein